MTDTHTHTDRQTDANDLIICPMLCYSNGTDKKVVIRNLTIKVKTVKYRQWLVAVFIQHSKHSKDWTTCRAMAHAVHSAIQELGLENLVLAMCFDTTSSNTGRLSGVCVILDQLLGRTLLHLGCRHHVLELRVLAAAFAVHMGPSKAPGNPPVQAVASTVGINWSGRLPSDYGDFFGDYVSSQLADTRDLIDWSIERLHQHSIGYLGDSFTDQKTQPAVSKYWKKKRCKSKENPEKANNTKCSNTIKRHIQKTQQVP